MVSSFKSKLEEKKVAFIERNCFSNLCTVSRMEMREDLENGFLKGRRIQS